jgi:hypothetical protein
MVLFVKIIHALELIQRINQCVVPMEIVHLIIHALVIMDGLDCNVQLYHALAFHQQTHLFVVEEEIVQM